MVQNIIYSVLAFANGTSTTPATLVGSVINEVSDIIYSNLGSVLTLIAGLIGIFFVVRLVRRYIGGSKG